LDVEDAIEADPDRYRREAEKELTAEEKDAEKATQAIEAERVVELEAEREEANRLEAQRLLEERQAKLDLRIHAVASRDVAAHGSR
jgi:hypothetical protein